MGEYNPRRPYVLGHEWAGIRSEPYILDAETERGHTFRLSTATQIVSGGIYMEQVAPGVSYKIGMVSVYEKGTEHLTGPIKRVVIPAEAAVATPGTDGSVSIFGGTAVAAITHPGDSGYIFMSGDANLTVNFDADAYTDFLSGKRIVDVNVLYAMSGTPHDPPLKTVSMEIEGTASSEIDMGTPIISPGSPILMEEYSRSPLGNTNVYFGASAVGVQPRRYPWRYPDLQRFEDGVANELTLNINTSVGTDTDPDTHFIYVSYVALEVLYCEETRLLYGGKGGPVTSSFALTGPLQEGQNIVHLRPSDTFAATGKVLQPGEYTVTVTLGDMGTVYRAGPSPVTRALRQRAAIPSHEGVEIQYSRVLESSFRREVIDVLPQISLYTGSVAVTGVHAYGNQLDGFVYAANDVTQQIEQRADASGVSYPQVRFYARRYGDTDVTLSLFRSGDATQIVTITPAELDALPEIVDGWREVTLRFTVVPTFDNSGTQVTWIFRANGLDAGNQWQVLATHAFSSTLATYNTNAATYGGDLSVMTGGGASGASSDVVLLFSQDPPAVSGLAVVEQSQTLTGIGGECATAPECVPTALGYHRVTWLPVTSLPASGFGYLELQRQDDVDTGWNTVMKTSSMDVTGFTDYEARVGIESRYRIRTANAHEFLGAWSASVANTLGTPGVTGVDDSANSVLIFTTNELQDGTGNLAYVMTWSRSVVEDVTFPEGSAASVREFYRRDFAVVFHHAERGGERFSRDIIVQNAAVSTGRVRDGFTSLRDLAWADVSYVCVRNELGDRWLAAVLVPSGQITRNRRLYIARIEIIETTQTPSQVDPTA